VDPAGADGAAPVAAWMGIGALLATAAVLLVGLGVGWLVARRRARASEPGPVDDLPSFLESPPGSSEVTGPASAVHVGLAASAPDAGRGPVAALPARAVAGAAAVAVLLLAVAGGLAATATSGDQRSAAAAATAGASRDDAPAAGTEARLRFAGVVLEQRAVGITATYPELHLVQVGGGPVARLTLPTWNCLSAAAPDDPVAAGCVPSRTEHAELGPPALDVTQDRAQDPVELRLAGSFRTTTRPTGGPPEATGRVYPIEVTVRAGRSEPGRWAPAEGELLLGGRPTTSLDGRIRLVG
jgi:hypothetical protein